MYVGVPERTMAMAAAERPEWRPMSSGECPRIVGPISAAFRRSLMSAVALDNWKMLSPDWYVLIVLSGVVLGILSTRLAIAAAWVTGHAIGSLVRLMVIVLRLIRCQSRLWDNSRLRVMSFQDVLMTNLERRRHGLTWSERKDQMVLVVVVD